MPDLLDCLMPACHLASAVTTPAVAGAVPVAVAAVAVLAVTVHRLIRSMEPGIRGLASRRQLRFLHPPCAVGQGRESGVRRQLRDSCLAWFKAGLAVQGKRISAGRGAFPDVIVMPPGLVAALSAHRAVAGLVDDRGGWSRTA